MVFPGAEEDVRHIAPLEWALFTELELGLPADAAAIYRRQVSCYQLACWSYRDKATRFTFEPPREFEEEYESIGPRFPSDCDGALASITFGVENESQPYVVKYDMHDGIAAVLEFDREPTSEAWKSSSPIIQELTLHFDPMQSSRVRPEGRIAMNSDDLSGWLRELAQGQSVQNLCFPFNEEELNARLANFDTAFPSGFSEILGQTDGIVFKNKIRIAGLHDIYVVDLDVDGVFFSIGQIYPECDPAYLLVRKGCRSGTLYRIDMEFVHPLPLGDSLRQVLKDILQRRVELVEPEGEAIDEGKDA